MRALPVWAAARPIRQTDVLCAPLVLPHIVIREERAVALVVCVMASRVHGASCAARKGSGVEAMGYGECGVG